MNIYLDYDNVLNNLIHVWLAKINKEKNTTLTTKHIKHWDWLEEQFGPEVNDFWKDPAIYEDDIVQPFNESYDFFARLSELGEVVIITQSWKGTERAKEDQIRRHFGPVEIIHTSEKYKVTNGGILIDDRADSVFDHCKINKKPGIIYTDKFRYEWSNPMNYLGRIKEISTYLNFRETYSDVIKRVGELE